jgi:hypothetical protein
MDDLKTSTKRAPGNISDPTLDKALFEVFWDNRRISNLSGFTIRNDDLFSVIKAAKEPDAKNEGFMNNPLGKIKNAVYYALLNIGAWGKNKIDFDTQDEKLRKEKRRTMKYINQIEDSFTTNDELNATHPHTSTREQRCYYTRHFQNELRDKNARISVVDTICLRNY